MSTPAHQQPTAAPLTDHQRAVSNRYTDIARTRPAHFAAMVRKVDEWTSTGVDVHRARDIVLEQYDRYLEDPHT